MPRKPKKPPNFADLNSFLAGIAMQANPRTIRAP